MNLLRFVTLAFLLTMFSCPLSAAPIDLAIPVTELSTAWRKLNDAQLANKPKDAIEALDVIRTESFAQKNHTTALWAIIAKARIESQLEDYGLAPAHFIRVLTPHLRQIGADGGLPASMGPLLEAVLAKAWWEYYQKNRWQLLRRTQTAVSPTDDFTTWDARSVLRETALHFDAALAEPEMLQKMSVDDLGILTILGSLPDTYRPSVFDFLACQAIDFFSAGEQGLSLSEDAFEPDAESPLLGSLEEFLAWQPDASGNGDSAILRAMRLYQTLLRFHRNDADKTALADVDLRRITWAAKVTNTTGGSRHIGLLEKYLRHYETTPLASAACAALAELLTDKEPVAARDFALQALALKPSPSVEAICENIRMSIEAPSIQSVVTERAWTDPWPEIAITYRNYSRIHFAAIPRDWAEELNTSYRSQEESIAALRAVTPIKKWAVDLPATEDMCYRTEKISAPRDLKPGYYYIIASIDENFSTEPGAQNRIAIMDVWVSNLALVLRLEGFDKVEGYVVDARSGEPVPKATVTAWRTKRSEVYSALSEIKTDKAGVFSFPLPDIDCRYQFHVAAPDGMCIATSSAIYPDDPPEKEPARDAVFFFTDRALYRPGQTIQFKGIAIRADVEREKFEILANKSVTVVLNDPNKKEAGRLQLKTNAFGSIAGSFTIPSGRLAGKYTLSSLKMADTDAFVRVEEYKRPKFEVTLPASKTAPKLNDEVVLTGKATAYTGAPIDNAKITWRVRRLTRWPLWCWWAQPLPAREIAHGVAAINHDGSYSIRFNAILDKTADPKSEPVFNYEVTVEVTDMTGEKQVVIRTVSVGYAAIKAFMYADEWQTAGKPVELSLSTKTLDDVYLAAQGTVMIHPLKQPAGVVRPELNERYSSYSSPAREWPEDDPVATIPFDTAPKDGAATGITTVAAKLPAGLYRAIMHTQDRFGRPVTARSDIRVLDPESVTHKIKEPFSVVLKKTFVEVGETFVAMWGSGYSDARAFVSIERYGKVLKRFWTKPGVTQQRIELPVTEAMRGEITICVFQVRDNCMSSYLEKIDIPWSNKELDITWEHFTSKLAPGGRQTWTARIMGPSAKRAAAEFCAVLYDASLDQFSPHKWDDFSHLFEMRQELFNDEYDYDWEFSNENARMHWVINHQKISYRQVPKTAALYRRWNDQFDMEEGRGGIVFMQQAHASSVGSRTVVLAEARMGGLDETEVLSPFVVRSAAATSFSKASPTSAKSVRLASDQTTIAGALVDHSALKKIPALQASADLSTVTARKNLSETAFFFPQLRTDSDGSVRMEFTAPEALTRWKFLGFAHDKQLRSTVLTDTAVTAKDLMVQPNPPRFLREGDTVEFTVKITNMTSHLQTGAAQLTFADASSLEPVDLLTKSKIENPKSKIPFTLAPNSSQTLSWRITIPDGQGFLTYKAVASTGAISDGEEGFLPVLSRRQLVTESITLPIRDAGTRTFRFDKLADSALQPASSSALQPFSPSALSSSAFSHESLTVQMTSNPAWYAVLALPNLMEFPHECSEQLFNRHYANALAAHIASSDPKIARVFEQWRNTPALDSPLLKNDDLKSVLIEETPWVRAATRESEQRRAIGQLFDTNRTAAQTDSILNTLAKRQGADGLWSWFPGGSGSEYITRYLVAGFARLRHFGITPDNRADAMLKRAVPALDAALAKHHAHLIKENLLDRHTITSADAYQLYVRSFFLKEIPIPENARAAYDFFAGQARKHWPDLPRQSQGHAALALVRMGDAATPGAIVTSLKQRAKNSDELGMYWADADRGWFWWQAPIETQALMIEVFDEVARDAQAVADLQLWLLKQKQTQAWPSTKATADAVYALLLRGANKLASDALVTVTLGDGSISSTGFQPAGSGRGMGIPPMSSSHGQATQAAPATQPEAGTGFYSQRIPGVSVTPAMGEKITVTKTDAGPAWGSVTWQYFQSIDKITPHEGTSLTLRKTLWKQINTASGPTLVSLDSTKLEPGDTLVARIELRTDRDMEFVHMKDQRGSGTEPVNVLSGYRWKNGLGYYESTRDTATHFFMDWLPAGTHVFEYPIRVQLRGKYESGIAEIQSMYAPEYNSHSTSTTLVVE